MNQHIGRIKRAVKWWVEEKLIPDAVADSLLLLPPLPAFRSAARETEPVGAVEWGVVQATVEQLVEPWRSLVMYQWWTGQRPGEACGLLVEWVTLTEDGGRVDFGLNHKTGWRGTEKTLPIGPQAANVLRPWIESAKLRSREFVFATTWTARGAEPRRTIPPSYARAVLRACKAAKVEPWHPNQLRHSFATRVRAALGLEAAQHALGHARADVTQIYAEKNQATAAEVARRLG
ncbi:tyrosine-type recombinase/integrase [Gemmata sp. SH-PL17]|uniref:tyrosine-type recombinase/integrase n=1 Tax=Gemmata sp. SH-PL17 TaxID=1630693 RepID=UPI00138F9EDF|nr:tyrosine-type recombinase/integrase [Gemmata sp. SH-PL17]